MTATEFLCPYKFLLSKDCSAEKSLKVRPWSLKSEANHSNCSLTPSDQQSSLHAGNEQLYIKTSVEKDQTLKQMEVLFISLNLSLPHLYSSGWVVCIVFCGSKSNNSLKRLMSWVEQTVFFYMFFIDIYFLYIQLFSKNIRTFLYLYNLVYYNTVK